jgi:predicted glutamine amidotransferase
VLQDLAPANFIYSDGDVVFIHGDRRHQGGGLGIRPPGLHVLASQSPSTERALHARGLSVGTGPRGRVVLAASVPLIADRGWRPLAQGEIVVLQGGSIRRCAPAPQK